MAKPKVVQPKEINLLDPATVKTMQTVGVTPPYVMLMPQDVQTLVITIQTYAREVERLNAEVARLSPPPIVAELKPKRAKKTGA